MSSVEIMDLDSKEWRKGPALPFGIYEAQMVEDQNGGVIIVGGFTNSNVFLDTLSTSAWRIRCRLDQDGTEDQIGKMGSCGISGPRKHC
jgi:hypothetical protein